MDLVENGLSLILFASCLVCVNYSFPYLSLCLESYTLTMLCAQLLSIHMHAHTHIPHHGCLSSVPGPVQNIEAAANPKQSYLRLKWDPPLNFEMLGGGTTYRIRFKPEGRINYNEKTVTTNHVTLTRNSGLKASKMHRFEVRAENAEAVGEWKIFSAFIGR